MGEWSGKRTGFPVEKERREEADCVAMGQEGQDQARPAPAGLNCFYLTPWEHDLQKVMGLRKWNSGSGFEESRQQMLRLDIWVGVVECCWLMVLLEDGSVQATPYHLTGSILFSNVSITRVTCSCFHWHSSLTQEQHRLLEEEAWAMPINTPDRMLEYCVGEQALGESVWWLCLRIWPVSWFSSVLNKGYVNRPAVN